MPRAIQDDLTDNPDLSRQEKYQIRRKRLGCCRICGQPAPTGEEYCLDHLIRNRIKRAQKKADVI